MQTATRRPERAFTLIELLVVIAIIAILAAILFPVFAKAREKGRTASCVSNEKQLGLAFTQYKQDYDETWPLMGIASDNTQGNTVPIPAGSAVPNCYDELAPYVKSSQMWLCPSSVGTKAAGYNSYHVNGLIMTNAGVADAQLSQPALTTIAREPGDSAVQAGMLCRPYQSNSPATAGNDDALANVNPASNARLAFHTGGSNFLFADGHAKTMPFSFYNTTTGNCRIVP